jgi:hypothetical protein
MDIRMHRGQSSIIKYLFPGHPVARYAVACASRGFGKSFLAATAATMAVQELLMMPKELPNKNVSIIAPTHGQVQDIYMPLLVNTLGITRYTTRENLSTGTFWFKKGVTLKLWSYEASERMRGSGQYFVVADEVCSWTGTPGLKESWESIVQPCMTTRWPGNHKALVISTPKGYDYFYEMFMKEQSQPDRWKSYHFTYKNSPYLSAEEIERVRNEVDPLKFAREYEASFEDSGANVFYCFSRKEHVDASLPYFGENEDVHVSIDFNVGIMAATSWAIRGNQLHALEDFQGHPDTDTLAKSLRSRYGNRRIYAYPDPTGKSRKTSAVVGTTDFTILQQNGIVVRARDGSPPIVDSVAAVNRKLKTANGQIEMLFHPKAAHTIKSIERTIWVESNPNTATIDKKEGLEHHSDGIRYITEFLYPVRSTYKTTKQGIMF